MSSDGHVRRWPMAIAAIFLCFILFSLQPVHQLKENPPQQFRAVPVPPGIDRQRWSDLYWERARFLQWKYSYGNKLPEQPTEDFHIPEEQTLPEAIAEQTRRAYWKELQQLWLMSAPWKVSYSVDFGWTRRAIEKAADATVDFVKSLRHSVHS
jgi:hypothetical protein